MGNREHTEQVERAATRFIAQRETGPWNDADARELKEWLQRSTLHRVAYYRLNAVWHEAGRLRALQGTGVDSPLRIRNRIRFFAVAASWALVAILTAAGTWALWPKGDRYSTPVGGLASVPMRDGSKITLNTDTLVHVAFSPRDRRISLDRGEAFFEVAPDPTRPFVVEVGSRRVIAVGTKFSVYRGAECVSVTVTQGAVRLEGEGPRVSRAAAQSGSKAAESHDDPVLLTAGTWAAATGSHLRTEKTSVAVLEKALSWRFGVLNFHEATLSGAVEEINRYNARKIVIADPALATIRIGGVFGATQPEAFAQLLEEGFPVRVSTEGDSIVLHAK